MQQEKRYSAAPEPINVDKFINLGVNRDIGVDLQLLGGRERITKEAKLAKLEFAEFRATKLSDDPLSF